MQIDEPTNIVGSEKPARQMRWGCIFSGSILLLLALLLMWDLYPVWGVYQRNSRLRRIATIGTPWHKVQPLLHANGYRVQPGINIGDSTGNIFPSLKIKTEDKIKLIENTREESTTEAFLIRMAMKIFPRDKVLRVIDKRIRVRFSRIVLDDNGNIDRVE